MKNSIQLTDEEMSAVDGGTWGSKPKDTAGTGFEWYRVIYGEPLDDIAKRYNTTTDNLRNLNSDILSNNNRIGQHMWIRVPAN